jgi:hypothetical protein
MGFRQPIATRDLVTADGSGRRIEITSAQADRITFFTGDAQEAASGRLYVGVLPGESSSSKDQGYVMLAPPELGGSVLAPEASLQALGQSRDGTVKGSWLVTGQTLVDAPLTPFSVARNDQITAYAASRTGTYTPAGTAITSGGFRQSGVGADPSIPTFTLDRAARVTFLAGFRVGVNVAGTGAALFYPMINGSAVASGVQRVIDETRTIFGTVDLAAGTHQPALRVEGFGGAVNWFNSWFTILTGQAA